MTFQPAENGWLAGEPSKATIGRAMHRMAARDSEARSLGVRSHFESDLRWVGDLGEVAFDRWLRESLGIEPLHSWNGGVDGKPDFEVAGHRVGLKTRYSNVTTRADFYAVVPAQHLDREQEDEWFFANYETRAGRLVLLGGIDKVRFREEARFVDTGEPIGPTILAKNPVWQLPVDKLEPPVRWFCHVLTGHALAGASCRCGAFSL